MLAREILAEKGASPRERLTRLNRLLDSAPAIQGTLRHIVRNLRRYSESNLNLPLKVAIPTALASTLVVGAASANVTALGRSLRMPLVVLIFLGSAGITSVLNGILAAKGGSSYEDFVNRLLEDDESFAMVKTSLLKAMKHRPAPPRRARVPIRQAPLMNRLYTMDPIEFESHVMSFFQDAGTVAWTTRASNDAGVDGFARHPSGIIVVQCKRFAMDHSVGRPDVQQFKGVVHENGAWRGYFVTTSRFTADAARSARADERLRLIDGPALASWHKSGVKIT